MASSKRSAKTRAAEVTEEIPIEEISVQLRPILGMAPRIYVPILWGLILLGILFFLLLFPGIRRNGTWMTIQTTPPDSAVYLDDQRLGASQRELFFPAGMRTLRVTRPGFAPHEMELKVRGRLFASLFFPRRQNMVVNLAPLASANPLKDGAQAFAAWTLTDPERERYAVPPRLTQAARDELAWARGANQPVTSLHTFLQATLPLAADDKSMAEVIRAASLLSSKGTPPSFNTLLQALKEAKLVAQKSPSLIRGALESLDENHLELTKLEDVKTAQNQRIQASINASSNNSGTASIASRSSYLPPERLITRQTLRYGGSSFVSFSDTEMVIGDKEVMNQGFNARFGALPTQVRVESVLIQKQEVSKEDFQLFVQSNPDWAPSNRENLTSQGLADANYLKDWEGDAPVSGTEELPVVNLSWHAAQAYTTWFNQRYLSSISASARLVREDEWEMAARIDGAPDSTGRLTPSLVAAAAADLGATGLRGIGGNVREWCLEPFRRNENYYRDDQGNRIGTSEFGPLTQERTVRGGAFIDANTPYPASLRGGLLASATSPVIGFRMAIQ